jgi:hypothetical protein
VKIKDEDVNWFEIRGVVRRISRISVYFCILYILLYIYIEIKNFRFLK